MGRIGFLLGVGLLAAPQMGHAEGVAASTRVALQWHADSAAPCLEPKSLEQRVEAQLGYAVFVDDPSAQADVQLAVQITHTGSEVQVELELSRGGELLGSRSLQGTEDHCLALLDSLVVVVALLVDVPRSEEPPPRAEPPNKPPAPRATIVPAPRLAPLPRTSVSFGACVATVSSLVPGVVGGAGLDLRASFGFAPPLSWRFGLSYWPRDRLTVAAGRVAFSAGSVEFGVAPIRLGSESAFHFEPWLFAAIRVIEARGEDFPFDDGGRRALPVIGPAGTAVLPLSSHLMLTAGLELGLALERPRFMYRDSVGRSAVLFRPAFFEPAGRLGAAWRF